MEGRRGGVSGSSNGQAMRSQKMKMMPTHRKTLDKNCSSACCGDPGAAEKQNKTEPNKTLVTLGSVSDNITSDLYHPGFSQT